ncbi:hypothetical protein [Novosphingobium sp. PC22D]|uniref:hypothetical protein n=1 Tax=Novosphingobium sp. PC22D TaxID=1962403 RepID=UPI00143C847B|nr:hypothetical protein [Novosphingobium sp. PC22D]
MTTRRGSPIIDRIFRAVGAKPGVMAKEIVDGLVRDGITNNPNSAYNAIARMKKSKELIGDGDRERELHLGPNAPTIDEDQN